jgi:hypothetical protein
MTESKERIIFDPSTHDGPVPEKIWVNLFANEPVKILALGKDEAPLYGWAGSSYSPELQQEHYLDNKKIAHLDLLAIKAGCTAPTFDKPAYRPFNAPHIQEKLAIRLR